jgi:hypothetical protein
VNIPRLDRLAHAFLRAIAKAARDGALMLSRAGGWWQGLG